MPKDAAPEPQDVPLTLSADDLPASAAPDFSASAFVTDQHTQATAHLANERTFLIWSLLALAIIGGGVALARTLIALNNNIITERIGGAITPMFYPTTMGLLFLGAGLLLIIAATCRYLSVQKQLLHQRYQPSSTMALLLLAVVLALCILLGGFLLQLRNAY